jgi:hypothetical protein
MADTTDVAGFISDKKATATQQTWVNGKWVNLADTNQRNNMQVAINKVGKTVTEQQAGIKTAQQAAENAMSSASAAIESSKVNSQAIADNSSAVNETKSDAANALDQAKSAMSAATSNSSAISTLDSSVSSSLSSANDRINEAKSAISANQAAIASAQIVANNAQSASIVATDTASEASVTAVDAKSNALIANQTASQASVTAVNAQSDALIAKQTAGEASITAVNAQSEANTVSVTASETKAALSNAQGDISALQVSASQASLDIASNSSAVASVTATAKGLQTTVANNSSAISGLKTTTSSQATQLSQTASQVALKADQTAVDTLKDTVTANSAAISVQADEIKQKVTSSDVQGLLNNGGYATQTWTSSQIDLTSNKFSLNLSALQTQVNNSAVGTNLYTDTKNFDNLSSWVGADWWTKTTDTYNGLAIMQTDQDWSGLSQYVQVKKGDTVTYSAYVKNTSGTGTSNIYWQLNQLVEGDYSTATASPTHNAVTITDSWQRITATAVATSDGYLRPRIERSTENTSTLQIAGIKVEKGSVATDWCPNPADNASVTSVTNLEATVDGLQTTVSNKVNTTDYNSKMTQLSSLIDGKVNTADYTAEVAILANDILARVKTDDLISQINIASDNILIQSGKLYLDAASVVFGGTAFITDAMITSLNADKITAGTIKGNLIQASSITADKMAANFFQVGLDDYGGNIKITPDTIQVYTPGVQDPTMVLTRDGLGFRDRTTAEQLGEIYGGPMYNNDPYYNGIQIGLFPNDDLFTIEKVAADNTTTPLFIWSESNKSDAHGIEQGFNFNDFVTMNKGLIIRDKIWDNWGDVNFHIENYNGAGVALINDAGAGVCFGNNGHLYFINNNKYVDSVTALNITGV